MATMGVVMLFCIIPINFVPETLNNHVKTDNRAESLLGS
jgi:hypothetical protein